MESEQGTTEEGDPFPLYCVDCGQLLDRQDERCFTCGAYQ